MTLKMALFVATNLGIGNFAYAFAKDQDWLKAFEHTYFQAWACLILYAADYAWRRIFVRGL